MHYEYDDGTIRISTVEALEILVPGAKWSIIGYDYEDIDWQDDNIGKPSKKSVYDKVKQLNEEYLSKEYQRLRAAEYPPMADYLDGIVKGDQNQIQAYIDACQAVKDKYPKPSV